MRFRLLLSGLCVFSAGAGFVLANNAAKVPQLQVGDKAATDVIATVRITAVDPEKTAALREKEAPRVPVIYRWNTNAIDESVLQLRDAFATNRQNFVVGLQKTFNRSFLEDRHLTNQRYTRFVGSFQSAHKSFPLTPALAETWARGLPDEGFVVPFERYLRGAMNRYLRQDEHPPEAKIGHNVKLVPSDAVSPLQLEAVQRTRGVARSNVIAIGKVRFDYRKETDPEARAIAKYASSFLQPTCIADAALTRQMREREVGTLTSVNRYEPGDVIVRKGEVVTPARKAALDELRGKLALLQGPTSGLALGNRSLTPWLIAGGATVFAAVVALFLWLRFRRKTMALALVPESLGQETAAAVKNDPVIRARLTEHLTRLLGQSVVQRLLSQRGELIKTQEAAVQQAEQLEERLEKVETDMHERFSAYEQRIVELEAELAAAEEQNRDLIRAKIAIAKEELERERAKARLDWN